MFVDVFFEHRRSERSETLAELDFQVQLLLHFRVTRVAEDAPAAEGPRPELHSTLKPADHFTVGQPRGDLARQHAEVVVLARDGVEAAECPLDFTVAELRAEKRAPHSIVTRRRRAFAPLADMPDRVRGAESATGVAGGRLNPHIL